MRLAFSAVFGGVILYCGFSIPAVADEAAKPSVWSLGATAGTLGVGVEASALVYDKVVFRVNGTYVKLDSSWVISSSSLANDYNLNATGMFAGGILDYHPFSSGWRLSAGARYVDIELEGVAKNGMSFGGVSYSASEVGNVTATIRNGNSVAPYLGFGYDSSHFSADGWGLKLGFDIGAMYIGEPDVSITTAKTPPIPAFASDVSSAVSSIKDSLRSYPFYPVAMLSARISF